MNRLVFALLVVLGVAAFAGAASAHVHGGAYDATTAASAVVSPPAAAEISAATLAAVALDDGSCDRDCGHTPGMGGCLCMAACAAVTLPDLPTLAPHPVRAAPPSDDSPVWRATTRGPPTPPPRA